MNNVQLIGRLTKDPEIRYTPQTQTCVARFSLAIDRPKDKDGNKKADFPTVVCWGSLGELAEKYLSKGFRVGITGRLQTGSYKDKFGNTVYTTEVVASTMDFLQPKSGNQPLPQPVEPAGPEDNVYSGLEPGDDIPF